MIGQSSKLRRKNILITLLIVSVLSVTIYLNKKSQPVLVFQGVVQSIFSYPKSWVYSLGKKERNDREARLINKVKKLEEKIVNYELLKKDNEALRNQFATSGESTAALSNARIVGFQGAGKQPTLLIINLGKKDNIETGMSVVFQNYLIGKIQTVSQNYSVVITPYNTEFQVLAKLPETNANGILVGKNDFMLFDGVVITDQLKKDAAIVTKGEVNSRGIGVAPDLIIGKISSISKRETAPFQSAQIIPLVDYTKLIDVFVVFEM